MSRPTRPLPHEPVPVRRVFLDTQVWVHFAEPRALGLPALVGAAQVILVVPDITFRELDKLKSVGRNRKVKDRAARALRAIESADQYGTSLGGGIGLEVVLGKPRAQLEADELDEGWADDVLVASVLAWQKAHPEEPTPALISDDTGPGMKCRHFGLIFARPAPAHRHRDEDEDQKEIAHLKREVARLQAAVPQPSLAFVDGAGDGPNTRIEVAPERDLDEADLEADIRARYPDMVDEGILSAGPRIAADRIEAYNDELETFRGQLLRHEKNLHELANLQRRCARLVLEVRNTGTAPADDVRLTLRFPEGMDVWLAKDSPMTIKLSAPEAPERPRPHDLFRPHAAPIGYVPRPMPMPTFKPVSTGPRLRIDDSGPSTRGIGEIERVMHGVAERLPELVAFVAGSASFSVDVELHAANRPTPVTGKLNVRVMTSSETADDA